MRPIACFSLGVLMWAGSCDRSSSSEFNETPLETEISIAGLKALCDSQGSTTISRDAAICGKVVANDLYDEFYHEIIIEDDSGGITIAINDNNLNKTFPFGAWVEVRCNGLVLHDYGRKIELGSAPDAYGNRGIPSSEINRYIRVKESQGELPRAVKLSFDEVQSRHVDTRVRFDGVRFAEAGNAWCDTDPETGELVTTEREIIDSNGNRFRVRTLGKCHYAGEALPNGQGSLFGVIDYFNGEFSLRVTFHEFVFQTNALPERIISDGLPNGLSPSLRSPVSRLSVVNTTSGPDKQSYDGSSGVDRARI